MFNTRVRGVRGVCRDDLCTFRFMEYEIMTVTTIRTVLERVYDANKPETLQGGESQGLLASQRAKKCSATSCKWQRKSSAWLKYQVLQTICWSSVVSACGG